MPQPRYNPTTNQFERVDANPSVQQFRGRFTAAQINAGASVLAAFAGAAYRLISGKMISIGGAAAGATAVVLLGTRAAGAVTLMSVAVAGLTQSTQVDLDDAAAAALADGASYTPLDANTAITIGKTGASLTGSTNVDVILEYVLE